MINSYADNVRLDLLHEEQVYQMILTGIDEGSTKTDYFTDHPAAKATGSTPQSMVDYQSLLRLIDSYGDHRNTGLTLYHSIILDNPNSPEAKKLLLHPYVKNLHESGRLREWFISFCDLINYIPAVSTYAPMSKIGDPHYWEYHNKVLDFSTSRAGILLSNSIINAACLKELVPFITSAKEPRFVDALCNLTAAFSRDDPRGRLIKLIADPKVTALGTTARKIFEPLSKETLKDIAKKQDTLRRRPKDRAKLHNNKDHILSKWLPMALWKMTSGEILSAVPELSKAGGPDHHEKNCKAVDATIRRLGLSRFK